MSDIKWHTLAKRGRIQPVLVMQMISRAIEKKYYESIYGTDIKFNNFRQLLNKREVSEEDYERISATLVAWMKTPEKLQHVSELKREEVSDFSSVMEGWKKKRVWEQKEKWPKLVEELVDHAARCWGGALAYFYIICGEVAVPLFIHEVQAKNPRADVADIMRLVKPEEESAMGALVKKLQALSKKKEVSEKELDALIEEYGHVGRYYFWGATYTREHLQKWISDIRKGTNEKEEHAQVASIQLDARQKELAKAFRDTTVLANEIDERVNLGCELLQPIFLGIAKDFGISYEESVNMTLDELQRSLRENTLVVEKEELTRRAKDHLYWLHEGKLILDTQKRYAEEIAKEKTSDDLSGELKGHNASVKKKITGIVKILHTPAEMGKLLDGEILVTGMTNPEFLPAMQRAAGYITEDGGLLCHAAVVARELGKVCIIGTKVATKVLKDGDRVEMDPETGIVRKL